MILRSVYARLAVPPAPFRFDPRQDRLVKRLCDAIPTNRCVINIGSGSSDYGAHIINLDIAPYVSVDVCGDAEQLPFRAGAFAGALLRGVLEHVQSADSVIEEVKRILAPGAFLYVEVPFLQPYHLSPEDHRRFTLPGLRNVLNGFEEIDSGVQIGPSSALAWVMREAVAGMLAFGSPWLYRKVLAAAGWATFWIKYLDAFVVPGPYLANAASAVFYLGRKR